MASGRSAGGPQTPSPVSRMAPKPIRFTVRSSPSVIVPAWISLLVRMYVSRSRSQSCPISRISIPQGSVATVSPESRRTL
jgi:hypothetical protein